MQVTSKQAVELLLQGSIVLAQMEHNGICIDVDYLNQTMEETSVRIRKLQQQLRADTFYVKWHKRFGIKTKLGSREQLASLLFDDLKLPYRADFTTTGRYKTDADVLRTVDMPFVQKYLRLEDLRKFKSTFLEGLQRETIQGRVHPFFHLHTVETFRGSSSDPNFQNIPRRDEELGKLIRQCFIPRQGRVLVESDFGALEFRIAACFWKDPAMIAYASDKNLDIHRDMAAEIFGVNASYVTKMQRDIAKNQFVFPILYGSYYIQCAKNIWSSISERNMTTVEGVPYKSYLKGCGVKELGACDPREKPRKSTFEYRLKQVEDNFNQRFDVFSRSKEAWWQKYQQTGQFRLMTGFVVNGVYSKNFLMNCPIQGPGFHCLLWSLIHVQKWLRKQKMKTLLVGQVHDCLIADTPIEELQDYLDAVQRIITVELPKAWNWIVCPLEIECEVAERNWHQKVNWVKTKGKWQPKE